MLKKTLSYNLKFFRHELQLSQIAAAHQAGISHRLYQNIEAGSANPTIDTLVRLSKAFEVEVARLLQIRFLRIKGAISEVIEAYKQAFDEAEFACAVRDFQGNVQFASRKAQPFGGFAEKDGSKQCLLTTQSEEAVQLLVQQIQTEQRGMVQPFISFSTDPISGVRRYFRTYPTLVLPDKGRDPLAACILMLDTSLDSEQLYHRYCSKLLMAMGPVVD